MSTPYASSTLSTPNAPSNPDLCRVYGRIMDVEGNPHSFSSVRFVPFPSYLDGTDQAGQVAVAKTEKSAYCDLNGDFSIDLLHGTFFRVYVGDMHLGTDFVVPDDPVAALLDHLYPYPTEVTWYYGSAASSLQEAPAASSDSDYGTAHVISASAGDSVFLALGVKISNGNIAWGEPVLSVEAYTTATEPSADDSFSGSYASPSTLEVTSDGAGKVQVTVFAEDWDDLTAWPAAKPYDVVRKTTPFHLPHYGPSQSPDPVHPAVIEFS